MLIITVAALGVALQGPPVSCTAAPVDQASAVRDLIAASNSGSVSEMTRVISARWLAADTSITVRRQALAQLGVEHWKSRTWRPSSTCTLDSRTAFVLAENLLSQETDSVVFTFDDSAKVSRLAA